MYYTFNLLSKRLNKLIQGYISKGTVQIKVDSIDTIQAIKFLICLRQNAQRKHKVLLVQPNQDEINVLVDVDIRGPLSTKRPGTQIKPAQVLTDVEFIAQGIIRDQTPSLPFVWTPVPSPYVHNDIEPVERPIVHSKHTIHIQLGPHLLTRFDLNPSMDKSLMPLCRVKLHFHSQTSTVQPLKFRIG